MSSRLSEDYNLQPSCVPTEGEELAGAAEGMGFPPQEPLCSEQVKTVPESPSAEPHCWPTEPTPRTGTEPTCSQGKVTWEQCGELCLGWGGHSGVGPGSRASEDPVVGKPSGVATGHGGLG